MTPRTRLLVTSCCLVAAACGGRIALEKNSSPDAGDPHTITPPSAVDASTPPPESDAGTVSPPPRDASTDAACDAASCRPSIDAAALAPCLIGGNVFHIEGDHGDPLFSGVTTITAADGKLSPGAGGGPSLFAVYASRDAGTEWGLNLASPLEDWLSVGTYEDAGPLIGFGKSALRIFADGRSCGNSTGRFEVVDMTGGHNDHIPVASITASFERFCQGTDAGLRGCVRYSPP